MAWTAPRTWADPEVPDAAMMNAHIRDNLVNIGQHQFVRKIVNEAKTNDASIATDDELILAIGANQTWEWEMRIDCTGGTSTGMQFRVDVPAGASGDYIGLSSNDTVNSPFDDESLTYGSTRNSSAAFDEDAQLLGIVVTAGTSGNLSFAWAQGASGAATSTVYANSYLVARRIS